MPLWSVFSFDLTDITAMTLEVSTDDKEYARSQDGYNEYVFRILGYF